MSQGGIREGFDNQLDWARTRGEIRKLQIVLQLFDKTNIHQMLNESHSGGIKLQITWRSVYRLNKDLGSQIIVNKNTNSN